MTHDGSGWLAASDHPESQAPECRSRPREHVGRAAWYRSVDGICFQCRGIGALGCFQCLDDESRHDTSPAIPTPDIETRHGPNRHIIDRLESWLAIEPAQILSRRELAPADSALAVKSQQAGWGPLLYNPTKCVLILLRRSLVIFRPDPPIHAPTTIACAALTEKGLKGRPQRGRKCSNCDRHVAAFRLLLWGPSRTIPANQPASLGISEKAIRDHTLTCGRCVA